VESNARETFPFVGGGFSFSPLFSPPFFRLPFPPFSFFGRSVPPPFFRLETTFAEKKPSFCTAEDVLMFLLFFDLFFSCGGLLNRVEPFFVSRDF